MQIHIISRRVALAPNVRVLAERRLKFALSRFASRIRDVSLTVSDQNGPKGGIDKECQVITRLHGLGPVQISCRAATVEACISHASNRIGRAVSRVIQKKQSLPRRRLATAGTEDLFY